MKLRKPESLGVFDNHDAGIGHVDALFNHRRRHQEFRLAVAEFFHNRLFVSRIHSAVK